MKIVSSQERLYDYTDRIVKIYLKKLIKIFKRMQTNLSQMKFDEINSISAPQIVNDGYEEIDREVRKCLVAIAKHVYSLVNGTDIQITENWIDEILGAYDNVTKYVYKNEVERKKSRYLESVLAVLLVRHPQSTIPKETKVALKLFAKQFEQYADNVTIKALTKAYEDNGVKLLRWNTQEDERVCSICGARDGKVYSVDELREITPAHFGCRCFVTPVASGKAKKITVK